MTRGPQGRLGRQRNPLAALVLAAALLAPGCSSRARQDGLVAQLADPATRERAIDGLLVLVKEAPAAKKEQVKERVVNALAEAYRRDSHRGRIVEALTLLRHPAAEPVFAAAIKDADRGGEYFEAAVRSARAIGELKLTRSVPVLEAALREAHARPPARRSTWLERALIQALERLGDRRAVKVLTEVLDTPPAKQDFYLNKLAARALGRLGDPAAVPALIRSLGQTRHGLLLFEESRVALCRIGRAAVPGLLRVAAGTGPTREGAVRVLGDLGDASVAPGLVSALDSETTPPKLRLALAETLLRLAPAGEAEQSLMKLVADGEGATLTIRRRAAELLGWYGHRPALGELLEQTCAQDTPARNVLCWALALAHARQGQGPELLDRLREDREDQPTRHYLQEYRPRLVLAKSCGSDLACYERGLSAADWRTRERAALELGRSGDAARAAALARRYAGEHAVVRQAILVSLERLAQTTRPGPEVGRMLARRAPRTRGKKDKPRDTTTRSRLLCYLRRVNSPDLKVRP
jgi:HEAT repeat protein